MANKKVFQSIVGRFIPQSNATNKESAPAYQLDAEHRLAQYAVTGCLNTTFYASAQDQLEDVLKTCQEVDPTFIAKTALFCREQGLMKDMPSLLCAVLSVRDVNLLKKVFPRVINNGKMLRNFVQIIRSGVVGRKSLGTAPKKLILQWIETKDDEGVFYASVGNDPSLADIVKMVHPKPQSSSRQALLGYLIGRSYTREALPKTVQEYEDFKSGISTQVPNVPMELLTALDLSVEAWKAIVKQASWMTTLMNLNTFVRHKVFEKKEMIELVAERLRHAPAIRKAKVFPYKIMTAFHMTGADVPAKILHALQDALEIALENISAIDGQVYICPDVSGSMSSPATGFRKGATSCIRCIDVAGLFASAILRKNSDAVVLPFAEEVKNVRVNPRDSVMTNAKMLADLGGGGTNCSAPLVLLNRQQSKGDLVIFVSDNQSWIDAKHQGTATMHEWNIFKKRNPKAKLVCIDIQPYGTAQAVEREDILNIGGFTDHVFTTIGLFAEDKLNADHWVGIIKKVEV